MNRHIQTIGKVLAVIMMLVPAVSSAADVSGNNSTTGADSQNSNQTSISQDASINVINCANVTNDFNIKVNTGRNNISNNTTVGDVKTGDINFDLAAKTQANTSSNIPTLNFPVISVTGSNYRTGSNSENNNNTNINQDYSQHIINSGTTKNSAFVLANTGDNRILNNTTVGDITTGSIFGKIVFDTTINDGRGGGIPQTPITPSVTENPIKTVLVAAATSTLAPAVTSTGFFPAGGNFLPLLFGIALLVLIAFSPKQSKLARS